MASGKLLRALFKSYATRDAAGLRRALDAIVQEERSKNHRLLADDLERIAFNGSNVHQEYGRLHDFPETPKDRETGLSLIQISEHDLTFRRLVASPQTILPLERIADEYHRQDTLSASGLAPTRTMLFYGPPGCGKTLAARVLASVLYRPLVTVRLDSLVSSFLGQTATNLRRIFDFLECGRWVVLFDEFDAIGKDRDNPYEHGELKRVVNSLLQLMDNFRGDSLFIAATNHEHLLDSAVWRRFETIVPFPLPTPQDRTLLLQLFLAGFEHKDINLKTYAGKLSGASGADVELVAVSSARRAVLDGRRAVKKEDLDVVVSELKERLVLSASSQSISDASR